MGQPVHRVVDGRRLLTFRMPYGSESSINTAREFAVASLAEANESATSSAAFCGKLAARIHESRQEVGIPRCVVEIAADAGGTSILALRLPMHSVLDGPAPALSTPGPSSSHYSPSEGTAFLIGKGAPTCVSCIGAELAKYALSSNFLQNFPEFIMAGVDWTKQLCREALAAGCAAMQLLNQALEQDKAHKGEDSLMLGVLAAGFQSEERQGKNALFLACEQGFTAVALWLVHVCHVDANICNEVSAGVDFD